MNSLSKLHQETTISTITPAERDSMLTTLVDSLPEMDQVHEVAGGYFQSLHCKERLDTITEEFEKMLKTDANSLNSLNPQGKAQHLLARYIAINSTTLESTPQFAESFQRLTRAMSSLLSRPLQQEEFRSLVRVAYISRVKLLHRDFPTVAIAKAMGIPPTVLFA